MKKISTLNTNLLVYSSNSLIMLFWWVAFNPGFYSADSFAVLRMLRSGTITSEGTAIWALSLNFLTLGGSQPQIATLFFSQLLAASISYFSLSLFQNRRGLLATSILCATPLVGAMGITMWHDIPMTAGFFLVLGSLKRLRTEGKNSYFIIILGGILASFRFNGLPVLIVFVLLLIIVSKKKKELSIVLGSLIVLAGVSASINTHFKSDLNVQSDGFIDWMRYDLSCYAFESNDKAFFQKNFNGELTVADWSSKSACTWFNDSKAFTVRNEFTNQSLPSAWVGLAKGHLWFVFKTHLERHKYLVPIPYSGFPSMPFIHTTIEVPNAEIEFYNPGITELIRFYPRIWNYFNFIFGYAGFWLAMLFVIAWRKKDAQIFEFGILGLTLISSLFIFASISDARFTLPLLIIGQLIVLNEFISWLHLKFYREKDTH